MGFVVGEVFPAQGADRNQPLGAGFLEGDEQAEAGDADDAGGEFGADAFGQPGGEVALLRVALGELGATLGVRDLLADGGEVGAAVPCEAVLAQSQRPDQGAVDEQVGVTPDRRGEVAVTGESKAEMAEVVRRVSRLGLAAQDHEVDKMFVGRAADLGEQGVEMAGPQAAAAGQAELEGGEEFAQTFDLGRVGMLVNPVHAGILAPLQGFRRGHVGGDHAFLDQPVAVVTGHGANRLDRTGVVEDDAQFGQLELQRAARAARLCQRPVDAVERRDDALA